MVPDASIAFAALILDLSSAAGRPPRRPRARLAASAVRVRSRRSSTSNCPRAAKMWRISPSPGRAGGVDVLVQRPQADAACLQGVHGSQKLAHGSRQSVDQGDDKHIPLAGVLQGGEQAAGNRFGCRS